MSDRLQSLRLSLTPDKSQDSEAMTDETPYTFIKDYINDDALNQSTWWYNRHGTQYRISDMNRYHAENALKKLWGAFGEECFKTPLWRALARKAYG